MKNNRGLFELMMWHWPNKRLMRCLLTNFKVDINICVMLMVKKFL